jgi:hypothetical protein
MGVVAMESRYMYEELEGRQRELAECLAEEAVGRRWWMGNERGVRGKRQRLVMVARCCPTKSGTKTCSYDVGCA